MARKTICFSNFRAIIVLKSGERAIFIFGFAKNEKENIDKNELEYLKKLGNDLLSLNEEQLEDAIAQKILFDLESLE